MSLAYIRISVMDEHGNELKIQRVVDNIGNFTIVVELPDPRSPTLREPVAPIREDCPDVNIHSAYRDIKAFDYCPRCGGNLHS